MKQNKNRKQENRKESKNKQKSTSLVTKNERDDSEKHFSTKNTKNPSST